MIYCASYRNPERKARMMARFETLGLAAWFLDHPTERTDVPSFYPDQRAAAVMLDHLALIRRFVRSGEAYGVFCEDDVFLRKSTREDLPVLFDTMRRLELDVLLLGYLSTERKAESLWYSFHSYPDDLWGSQCYMLGRSHARWLLEKYETCTRPFSPDWCITKDGRRACVYPMIAVEEGDVATTHPGHVQFHQMCRKIQYDPAHYV